MHDQTLLDDYLRRYLDVIEHDIHGRKNRVRYSMNNAMIAIGIRNQLLREEAIAAAQQVGPVEVDHLKTNCRTPEAASYIARAWERRDMAAVRSA